MNRQYKYGRKYAIVVKNVYWETSVTLCSNSSLAQLAGQDSLVNHTLLFHRLTQANPNTYLKAL